MKRKNLSKEELLDMAVYLEHFGLYDTIFVAGGVKPGDVLDDERDIRKVEKALVVIEEYIELIPDFIDIREMDDEINNKRT